MLFSAGLGTRLYPLTADKPKALAPFMDTTLLAYNLRFLASQGINKFIINTHHFAEKIEEYLYNNEYFGYDIIVSYEKNLLDTAGGVAKIKEHVVDEEHLLLYNVDIISNLNVASFLNYHKENNSDISLATRNRETSRYLLFDDNNRMQGWKNIKTEESILCKEEKDLKMLAFSGISLLSTSVIEKIGSPEKKSLITFYLDVCKEKKISAYIHNEEYWFDCGNIEKLAAAESYCLQNNLNTV